MFVLVVVSVVAWGQDVPDPDGLVRGGLVEAVQDGASWASVSVERDPGDPETFTIALGETSRGDASLHVLELGPGDVVEHTAVPSVQADASWAGAALCAIEGVTDVCLSSYPGPAEPGVLSREIDTLGLEAEQAERLLRALGELGVDGDVPLLKAGKMLTKRIRSGDAPS